ncbi:MAG: site-2 protease family protein [Anaerolineae bacterium]
MNNLHVRSLRLGKDRVFWLVVAGIVLLYIIVSVDLARFLPTVAGLLLAITVHECAHAWTADRLGDPTARYLGRVSLNPLVHLDPLGTIMMGVTALTGMGIGWGKPVPVTPYRLRYGSRRGGALVSLAGPAANLLLAGILGLVFRFSGAWPYTLRLILNAIVLTNVFIAMFNLLPIPPLDGHAVLLGLLSLSASRVAYQVSNFLVSLQRQGPMLLIGLIVITQLLGIPLLSWVIGPPATFFYQLFTGIGA